MFKKLSVALIAGIMIISGSVCLAHHGNDYHNDSHYGQGGDTECNGPRYGHDDEYDHNGPHHGGRYQQQ